MFKNHLGVLGTVNYSYTFLTSSGISSYGMQVALISEGSKKLTLVVGPNLTMTQDKVTYGVSAGAIYIQKGE